MKSGITKAFSRAIKDFELDTNQASIIEDQLVIAEDLIQFNAIWKINILCNDLCKCQVYIPICEMNDGVPENTQLLSSDNIDYIEYEKFLSEIGISILDEKPNWYEPVLDKLCELSCYSAIEKVLKTSDNDLRLDFSLPPLMEVPLADNNYSLIPNLFEYNEEQLTESLDINIDRRVDLLQKAKSKDVDIEISINNDSFIEVK